jgi:hypothetical protein
MMVVLVMPRHGLRRQAISTMTANMTPARRRLRRHCCCQR